MDHTTAGKGSPFQKALILAASLRGSAWTP
jgi:hypothetical protein